MSRHNFSVLALTAFVLFILPTTSSFTAETTKKTSTKISSSAAGDFSLTILFTNGIEASLSPVNIDGSACVLSNKDKSKECFGGAARLAGAVAKIRREVSNVLLVDTGGNEVNPKLWNQRYNRTATLMRLIGVNAMALGYTELSSGTATLRNFINEVRFPILAANIDVQQDPFLRDHIFPIYTIPYTTTKVGIIGITSADLHNVVTSLPQTVRLLPIQVPLERWARAMYNSLKVNKVIVINRAGSSYNEKIVKSVPGLSVIVSSSNSSIDKNKTSPVELKGVIGQTILLIPAAPASRLGRVDLVFANNGQLKSWRDKSVILDKNTYEDDFARTLENGSMFENKPPI